MFLLTTRVFVGAVSAIFFAVTEETPLNTSSVPAGQVAVLAKRLLGVKQGLHFTLLVLQLAVFDRILPITGLFLDVEKQPSGTTDGLDTLL